LRPELIGRTPAESCHQQGKTGLQHRGSVLQALTLRCHDPGRPTSGWTIFAPMNRRY
jgi:hypothetical protein